MGHVDQAAQEVWPALLVNVPPVHAVHARLLVAVATALRYSPARQAAPTVAQAAPSFALE
jgi:hypothetical protein